MHKVLLFLVLILLIIGGAIALVIYRNSDENTDEQTENSMMASETIVVANGEPKLESKYLESYEVKEEKYGTVTKVTVDENANTRTIESNALPNHDTGDFPNSGNPNSITAQTISYSFPLEPKFTGQSSEARTPGVAVNGVKFEPGTAEVATCDGGQTHRIEALQDEVNLGLDFNNAHVQPGGEYHYHGVSTMLADAFKTDNDLVHIGFAADGHLIFYSKSGSYKPSYEIGKDMREGTNCSYSNPGSQATTSFGPVKDGSLTSDWDYVAGSGELDECNGVKINNQYIYLVTDEYPYISRCLMGEFTEIAPGGSGAPMGQGAPTGQNGPPQGPPPGPRP